MKKRKGIHLQAKWIFERGTKRKKKKKMNRTEQSRKKEKRMCNVYNKFVKSRDSVVDLFLFFFWCSYARCTFDFYVLRNLALGCVFRASYLFRFAGRTCILVWFFVCHFLCNCVYASRRQRWQQRDGQQTAAATLSTMLLQFALFMSFSNFTFWGPSWQRFILVILFLSAQNAQFILFFLHAFTWVGSRIVNILVKQTTS